jgi:YidC/Oxa1 family membrane protein insertase
MSDQKNLILAITLSLAILFGFQFFYEAPRQKALQEEQARQRAQQEQLLANAPAAQPSAGVPAAGADALPGSPDTPATVSAAPATAFPSGPRDRTTVLAETARVRIDTPALHGSLNLRGGRFDDLTLAGYRVDLAPTSPEVTLLSPTGATGQPYFAEFGWVAAGGVSAANLPSTSTVWTATGGPLTPTRPVTLRWDNGQGLVFERQVAVDADYMFTVTDRVLNNGSAPVALAPYGRVQRIGTPQTQGFYILHEGPIGVFDSVLNEYSYADLLEDRRIIEAKSTGGWVGFTDKYWLVSLVPDQSRLVDVRVFHQSQGATDAYQTDFRNQPLTIEPGASAEAVHRLFAGAKIVDLLDRYKDGGIARFTYAIDWGWFYFLTQPFFHALDFLGSNTGNFGIGIIIFTVFLRLAFFPLANKQYESFAKMKLLQPKLEELRARCGDDKQRMSMEMMNLYKQEKVNPLAGCLPILIQIPVFFALYKVLFVTIEMRHAPFYGWIQDLSAPDPTNLFTLFGLIPWVPPAFLHLGALPLLFGITMWLQMKLSPSNPDPIQQRIFMIMPFIFTYFTATFPAGLVIYWTWSNILAIGQQWLIMRRMGVKMGT